MTETVEAPQQSAGYRIAQCARTRPRTTAPARWSQTETELAIDVPPSGLILAAALVENTSFQGMVTSNPCQVLIHIDGRVGLLPWSTAKIASGEIGVVKAIEAEVWNGLVGR